MALHRWQRAAAQSGTRYLRSWYHRPVAVNLRLSDDAAAALRAASRRTGRSQQELLREAVDRYLGLERPATAREQAIASGLVRPPTEFRDFEPTVQLRAGVTTADLLDRDADR